MKCLHFLTRTTFRGLSASALIVLFIAAAHSQSPVTTKSTAPNYDVSIHGKGSYIATPDGRIYYESEGSGPVIVLVAGGPGGSHASFHPWFSQLAKDHTVIYFDNIGRGRSDRLKDPKRYTVVRDADDIEALRKKLGVEKITVLGHSYGGMPALAYALKYTSHTERLILSDTLHGADSWQQNIDSANFNAQTRYPEVWEKLAALRKSGVKTGAEAYEDPYGDITEDLYWYNRNNAAKMFHSSDKADGMNIDIYFAMIGDDPEWTVGGTMKGYDPRPRMKSLNVPTLICVGRFDRIATPKIAWQMKEALPAASSTLVIFEKSGHRPWVEETQRYFQVVEDFLAGKTTASGAAPTP